MLLGALAGSKQDANFVMDGLLRNSLPGSVRSKGLDPKPLPGFVVKVDSTSLTNRDFKTEFKPGMLYGLSTALRRQGDCGVPGWQGANVTMGCYISLAGLRVAFDGSAKGFDLIGTKKAFKLDLVVENTNAFVEITGAQGRTGVLKTLSLTGINFRINTDKNFGLNDKRTKKFQKAVSESVKNLLMSVLLGDFRDALSTSARSVFLPRP